MPPEEQVRRWYHAVAEDSQAARTVQAALKRLEHAASFVALKDNSDKNPEAVELREALDQARSVLRGA